jgi:acylphosphatase
MPEDSGIELVARLLRIHGRVQGVYYRASAQEEALRLGLSGWVRNRSDGSVEALVAGCDADDECFIRWAWQGPAAARVVDVEIQPAEAPEAGTFRMRPTE